MLANTASKLVHIARLLMKRTVFAQLVRKKTSNVVCVNKLVLN